MRTTALFVGATAVFVALMAWAFVALDTAGIWFAFVVVWLPMVWLGTVSRLVTPRLPHSWHTLRPFERDGRVYELLGVRVVKRLLRRGPLAVFNPHLHLPTEMTTDRLAHLEQRMCDAEASHTILLVATFGVAALEAAVGNWSAAAWVAVFNLLLNGYPVMLQRYNRALLHQRFAELG